MINTGLMGGRAECTSKAHFGQSDLLHVQSSSEKINKCFLDLLSPSPLNKIISLVAIGEALVGLHYIQR